MGPSIWLGSDPAPVNRLASDDWGIWISQRVQASQRLSLVPIGEGPGQQYDF